MDLYNFLILLSPSILVIAALTFVAVMRYIAYKERVALAEHGVGIEDLFRSQQLARQGNRGILWAGAITSSSGLGILLGLWTLGGVWLITGFLPLCVGLGMLAIFYVTRGSAAAGHDHPQASPSAQEGTPGPAGAATD